MKKLSIIDPKKPTINNRASIISIPEMEIIVLWKHQLDKAITWLVDQDIQFQWVPENLLESHPQFKLVVYGLTWAYNLVDFAKILAECDYSQD